MIQGTHGLTNDETEFIIDDDFGPPALVIRAKGQSITEGFRLGFLEESHIEELETVLFQLHQIYHEYFHAREREIYERLDRGVA